nr:hypothetical protein [Tanacetum cinerariifolium]
MDQKLRTYAKRADNKRKSDDTSRNNHEHQQQPFKKQNVTKVYNMETGDRKPYEGSLPKCTRCQRHHNGPCTQKCYKCNKVGHFARNYKNSGNANVANAQRDAKEQEWGNKSAQGWVYAVGNAEKNENAPVNPDSNVVMGTFLLNNRYASILFNTGADGSFISTAFSLLIRTLGPEAYAMTWEVLKKKITDKYCPQGELKKLNIELWNLKVKGNDVPTYTNHFQELTLICTKFVANENKKIDKYISGLLDSIYGNVKSSKPRTLDETIKLTNDLMDQKLRTYAKRADNKRKSDDTSRNNHEHQQQPFKKQ